MMMIPKKQKHKRVKPGPIKNKPFMKYISALPCCVCGTYEHIQAHHPIANSTRRRYGKAHDTETVPLCFGHHAELHDKIGDEEKFQEMYGVDFKEIAGYHLNSFMQ